MLVSVGHGVVDDGESSANGYSSVRCALGRSAVTTDKSGGRAVDASESETGGIVGGCDNANVDDNNALLCFCSTSMHMVTTVRLSLTPLSPRCACAHVCLAPPCASLELAGKPVELSVVHLDAGDV